MRGNLADVAAIAQTVSRALAGASATLLLVAIALAGAGCSAKTTASAEPAAAPPPAAENGSSQPAVTAKITITYEKQNDTLESVTVKQFTGATVIRNRSVDGKQSASIVRFDGGVTIWKFHSNRTVLNPLSEIESGTYRVEKVGYGDVPTGFTQDVPESGVPEPLAADSFYIFTIKRASGAISYEAVKVNADTSLQVYDADPRAGTSYELCCDLASDFAQPTPPSFTGQVQ